MSVWARQQPARHPWCRRQAGNGSAVRTARRGLGSHVWGLSGRSTIVSGSGGSHTRQKRDDQGNSRKDMHHVVAYPRTGPSAKLVRVGCSSRSNGPAISRRPCDGRCQRAAQRKAGSAHRVYGLSASLPCYAALYASCSAGTPRAFRLLRFLQHAASPGLTLLQANPESRRPSTQVSSQPQSRMFVRCTQL